MQHALITKVGFTAVALATLLGLLFYMASSPPPEARYRMVDDLVHEVVHDGLDRWRDRPVKVHGWVGAGSIHQAVIDGELRQTFLLQKSGRRLRVFTRGPVPDTFRDTAEVVIEGHLADAADFERLAAELTVRYDPDAEPPYVLDGHAMLSRCLADYRTTRATSAPVPEFK